MKHPAIKPVEATSDDTWIVTPSENELRIGFGSGTHFPQYRTLHLNDSYFRLNYGPNSSWGTSIILLPVFWSAERCPSPGLRQGAQVNTRCKVEGSNLLLSITGIIGGLHVSSELCLFPPAKNNAIAAQITTNVEGNIPLDHRPGEAFKPVMLSSMHISPTKWDMQTLDAGGRSFPPPKSGWIIEKPILGRRFSLRGGTSEWKPNAPTINVVLDRPRLMQITGFVTQSDDPNDDNVGVWAATDAVLPSWSFWVGATSKV